MLFSVVFLICGLPRVIQLGWALGTNMKKTGGSTNLHSWDTQGLFRGDPLHWSESTLEDPKPKVKPHFIQKIHETTHTPMSSWQRVEQGYLHDRFLHKQTGHFPLNHDGNWFLMRKTCYWKKYIYTYLKKIAFLQVKSDLYGNPPSGGIFLVYGRRVAANGRCEWFAPWKQAPLKQKAAAGWMGKVKLDQRKIQKPWGE